MRIHRASVSGYQTMGRAVSGILVLLLLCLTSCSESTQPTTGLDASHGAIAVSVYVNQDASHAAPSTSVLAAASNPPIDCVSLMIKDITIHVQDSGGTVRGSGDFACADHEGTLTGIPAGSGYTVTVIGKGTPPGDANKSNLLQGEVTGIMVTPNSTVPASVGLHRIPWGINAFENVKVSAASKSQINPGLAPIGSGGAFIVWEDNRLDSFSVIAAQRLDSRGSPRWDTDGVLMFARQPPTATQSNPKIVASNNGGALVVWEYVSDLYLGRIPSDGEVSDFDICPLVEALNVQKNPQIVSDGVGGHIIVWEDRRSGNFDIYAQRLGKDDLPPLCTGNGIAVSRAVKDQKNPQLISDGAGGAIIVWQDERASISGVYAQRIDSNGERKWKPDDGVVVSLAANIQTLPFLQAPPQLVSDGAGGAIIVWQDERTRIGVYAQRIDSNGERKWKPDDGVVVSLAANNQTLPQLVSDGKGGAIIGWGEDLGDGVIFAQRLNENGERQWPSSVQVTPSLETIGVPRLISDRAGGAIFTYATRYFTLRSYDIYAKRLDHDGVAQWGADGVAVGTARRDQVNPGIVEDGAGGAIIAWQDFRNINTTGIDIYAQGITATGAP